MKTDRELLELAAKAAGHNINQHMQSLRDQSGHAHVGLFLTDGSTGWNPLTEDRDSFRLALTLNMDIEIGKTFVKATWYDLIKSETHTTEINFSFPEDKGKCAKRAIVLAAAEIGASL